MMRFSRKHQKGFTALEFLIAAAIMASIMAISSNFLFQNQETTNYLKTQNMMKDRIQSALYRIEKSLAQSKRLYGNDTIGQNFVGKLQLSNESKSLIVLPTIRPTGTLVQTKLCDAYPENFFWPMSFGNSLFFVQLVRSFNNFGFDSSENVVERKINLYKFMLYYVENNEELPLLDVWNDSPGLRAQNLVRWESKLYADYGDFIGFMSYLNGIDASKISTVVDKLNALGVAGLWNAQAANPNQAFYELQGSATPALRAVSYRIERMNSGSALLLPENDSTLYSIAYNTSSQFPIKTQVPQFYRSNPSPNAGSCGPNAVPTAPPSYGGPNGGFPGGFEVGIVGPNSGRSVFINLTAVGRIKGTRLVEKNHSISAFAKDY